VYARISLAHRDMETELECLDSHSGKAAGFGELKEGFMVTVSLKLARDLLLSPNHPVLKGLSGLFPFELAIGWNGRIWMNAAEPLQIILISQMLKSADATGADSLSSMVKAFVKSWKASQSAE
jgi:exosome complex component RRP40